MERSNRKMMNAAKLRKSATAGHDRISVPAMPPQTDTDVRKLLHELQVHQIELEMQNAELQSVRADLELSLARYTDLYDFAPIGYLTLDTGGFIHDANLTSADMLGMVRSELMGRSFGNFVTQGSQLIFRTFLQNVFSGHDQESCEVALLDIGQSFRYVHITATADASGNTCRMVMLDVNERKKVEAALRQSREELRQLAGYQERIKEDERKRIAREIHDDLGQNLLALRIDIAMLHARTGRTHPHLNKRVWTALHQLDATMKAVRSAINNLRPTVLDLGLNAAIEWQVQEFQRRSGIPCELSIANDDLVLDDNRATALFRILQESLNNVVRHAKASGVHIDLYRDDDKLCMQVQDDGVGIFPGCRRKANVFGLIGMKERILALGGELSIESEPDKGTMLAMSIPVD